MDENVLSDGPHRTRPVYVNISFERNLALLASPFDTIASLKIKLMDEYALFFPSLEPLMISGLKVKRRGKFYRLSESMLVSDAFYGVKGNWFLSVDVSTSNNNGLEVCSPNSFAKSTYDRNFPRIFETLVDRNEILDRETDCLRVFRRDPKEDLNVKSVQDSDETHTELKALKSKAIEDASINARHEFTEPLVGKSFNVEPMVSGENDQEKEFCGYSVKNAESNCISNHDEPMECPNHDERTDLIKKKKKKHKSKEVQLSITDKAPEFEVLLGAIPQESVVGCNSSENPVGVPNLCKSDALLLASEIIGNIEAEKVNEFILNSISDGNCDPNNGVPIEGSKADEKNVSRKKKKKRTTAIDASIRTENNKNEAVQDHSSELHQVIRMESVQEKMDFSQESFAKESLLDKCSRDITEKNDTAVNHSSKSEINWSMEKDKGNESVVNSQSLNNVLLNEKHDFGLNKKSKRKKKFTSEQPNMNDYKKNISMSTNANKAEADQSTYCSDQNTVVSVKESVKHGDDQTAIPLPGIIGSNASENTKTKKRKKKIEETETILQNTNENQLAASKEKELVSNQQAESNFNINSGSPISECTDYQPSRERMNGNQKVNNSTKQGVHNNKKADVPFGNANLVPNKIPDEIDRNVESNILSSPPKAGDKMKKKKIRRNDSLLDGKRENSLHPNENYLIKEPSSKELSFNGLAASPTPKMHLSYEASRVGEACESISNQNDNSVAPEKVVNAKKNARKVQKTDAAEMPVRKPKTSKGSQQSGCTMEHVESANCKTSEADFPDIDAEVSGNEENIQFMDYFSDRKRQKHVAIDKSNSRNVNPVNHEQHEVIKPNKSEDKDSQKRQGESLISLKFSPETLSQQLSDKSKPTEENLSENSYDSGKSNYSTSPEWSEGESDECGTGSSSICKKNSAKAMMSGMSFCDVLRGSSSYKKAKKSTSHSFVEGLQSQSFDFVPDSCPS